MSCPTAGTSVTVVEDAVIAKTRPTAKKAMIIGNIIIALVNDSYHSFQTPLVLGRIKQAMAMARIV